MKPQNILRQLNLSQFFMLAAAVYCAINSFNYMSSDTSQFFFVVGGVTSVVLGFAVVLNVLNFIIMPKDKFYTNWAWINYTSGLLLLFLTFIKPEEILMNYIFIFAFSVINIVLFINTLTFRGEFSTYMNKLRKLFPDENTFNLDFDFDFKRDFEDHDNSFFTAVCVLTPMGKVVFLGDDFYFNERFYDANKFVKDLKECGFTFNKVTADEMKVVEMHVY